jgi:hypothetical protein
VLAVKGFGVMIDGDAPVEPGVPRALPLQRKLEADQDAEAGGIDGGGLG